MERSRWRAAWVSRVAGAAAVAALPPLHVVGVGYLWRRYNRPVNRDRCSCTCWDTVFKGPYETGLPSYKHFYFNATENTFKIWLLLVAFVWLTYESVRRLSHLALTGRLRYEMGFLFFTSIFSHYYSWWSYVNYYNDEFYDQWNHQMLFTVTELISSGLVLHLSDNRTLVTRSKVLVICVVAALHIVGGGWDQFYHNVLLGQGQPHQILRDLLFMVPDWLHLLASLALLRPRPLPRRHLLLGAVFTTGLCLFTRSRG